LEFTFQLVTEIQRKLAAGEKADVILLPVPLIAATEKSLRLRTEGRIVLARVGIGVIAWADPSTAVGGHLDRAIAQLGIAGEVRPKLIISAAIHGGAELVAKGEADFGLYLVSEVQTAKGITLVGLLPASFQSFIVYGAAVPADSAIPEAAAGFELVGER
jgi:ABC-type molybdate transport system substrate-binding protein